VRADTKADVAESTPRPLGGRGDKHVMPAEQMPVGMMPAGRLLGRSLPGGPVQE